MWLNFLIPDREEWPSDVLLICASVSTTYTSVSLSKFLYFYRITCCACFMSSTNTITWVAFLKYLFTSIYSTDLNSLICAQLMTFSRLWRIFESSWFLNNIIILCPSNMVAASVSFRVLGIKLVVLPPPWVLLTLSRDLRFSFYWLSVSSFLKYEIGI